MRRTQEVTPVAPLRSRRQSCSWKKTIKQLKSWSWRLVNLFCQTGASTKFQGNLVRGLEHVLFSIIYGVILRIDYYFFKMVKTTNQQQVMFGCRRAWWF